MLRAIFRDPETNMEDTEEIIDIPERRSSYLFRSRRAEEPREEAKRSSSYLLRTRKSTVAYDPRAIRGESYLFRTRKSSGVEGMDRPARGSYLFRTRKADQEILDRVLRSKSYLFRTRWKLNYYFFQISWTFHHHMALWLWLNVRHQKK